MHLNTPMSLYSEEMIAVAKNVYFISLSLGAMSSGMKNKKKNKRKRSFLTSQWVDIAL